MDDNAAMSGKSGLLPLLMAHIYLSKLCMNWLPTPGDLTVVDASGQPIVRLQGDKWRQ